MAERNTLAYHSRERKTAVIMFVIQPQIIGVGVGPSLWTEIEKKYYFLIFR
jgi:hypothetical protein